MHAKHVALRPAVILTLVLGGGVASARAETSPKGVVVEGVHAAGVAARAGLRPGDVLVSWASTALPAGGTEGGLGTPFDLAEVRAAQGQCGPVTLTLDRGGRTISASLGPGDWLVDVRPVMPPEDEAAYAAARALTETKDLDRRLAVLRQLAVAAGRRGEDDTRAWLLVQAGNALASSGRREEQRQAFAEAREAATSPVRRAAVWEAESQALLPGDVPGATAAMREAIGLRRALPGPAIALAADLNRLGRFLLSLNDPPGAEVAYREGLSLAEGARPGSLVAADSLTLLSWVVGYRSTEEAAALAGQALEMCNRLAPDSLAAARAWVSFGGVAYGSGDSRLAEERWLQAHALYERLDPNGPAATVTLGNLALIARERGDHQESERLFRRMLAYWERTSRSLELVNVLLALGALAEERSDLAGAEGLYKRALTVAEGLKVESLSTAQALRFLGDVAGKAGRHAEAEARYRRARGLLERLVPDTSELATYYIGHARMLWESGNRSEAVELASRALALYERLTPTGFEITEALLLTGDMARERGDREAAGRFYERALALRSRLAPGTRAEAESLLALARLRREEGRVEAALELSGRAIDALDRQRGRIGGSYEARSRFSANAAGGYREHLELLLEKGDAAAAFHVLERSRARAFLDLLAERDLEIAGVSPELDRERRALDAECERLQETITSERAPAPEALASTLGKLQELRDRREAIVQRLRQESPRLAAIRYPVPLNLPAARSTLDPGTVLLSYAVGPRRTLLFIVESAARPGPGVTVRSIEVDEPRLRRRIQSLRRELQAGPAGDERVLRRHAAELYALLVEPAAAQVGGADRLAISPDGPLSVLPFGALLRNGAPLVAWKPVHVVLSVTAAAELAKARPEADAWERDLLAFGEPHYGPSRPLPATRREVEAIGALFPGRAEVLVGRAATEEKAKALARSARYVHFACHGVLDQRFPLDSALVLARPATPSAGENGLLQAWEILEGGRLNADLVTLSACESGLGAELGGEGLLGLTRAFLHAGARSVVASLWRVSDRSTARLMQRFYSQLAKGVPKDQALRAAQLEMIRAGRPLSHPFYWAAFHLVGDWR